MGFDKSLENYVRQRWGTYLLSRDAWIVHYRWQAAKSM